MTSYAGTIAYGRSGNLQAPAADPAGYTFWHWTVNGMAKIWKHKEMTFTMTGAMTIIAQYTAVAGE